MAKRSAHRCMSEIDPRPQQNLRNINLPEFSKSQEISLCASPSLKYVIKKNVVQMRKEAFEKICQDEVNEKATHGRQVKSDSSIGLVLNQGIATQGQERLRSSQNVDYIPSETRINAKQELGGVLFSQLKPTMSSSVVPSETNGNVGEGTSSRREKPRVQPKPGIAGKRFLSVGFPDSVGARDTDSCVEFQHSPFTADGDEVFPLSAEGVEKKPDGSNSKATESPPSQPLKPILPVQSGVTSAPIPPPKPPRSLSEVCPSLEEREQTNFQQTDVKINEGGYDCLKNAVSVVLPVFFPETQMPGEDTTPPVKVTTPPVKVMIPPGEVPTPKTQNNPGTKITTPRYEEVGNVLLALPEVKKKPEKGKKKEHKWGAKLTRANEKKKKFVHSKTLHLDNPSYGIEAESDSVNAGCSMVRYSSDNALNRKKGAATEELVYDVPYMVTGVVTTASDDFNPVCFDEGGYAIPDVESKPCIEKSQSKARSKVRHAYDILRLPNETGDTTQIEDADNDEEEHEKHLLYVKSVRHYTSASIAKYEQVKLKSAVRLFQYGMIIGLEDSKPKVLFCIPSEMQGSDSFICNFCFPDADMLEPMTEYEGELFSFVLTSETGDRRYGWCKRYLPNGSGPRFPEALCIVSPIGEFGMYEQLLRTLQEYRSHSMDCAVELIEVAYARPMPAPNKEVYIRTEIPEQGRQTIILKRASETAHNVVPFNHLLEQLPVPVLIQVFGAILMERKVIFCASRLSILSSCICAMVALLYPFEWQHTFVTVLPTSLIDIVEAPTPFIVGILTSMKPLLEGHDVSEVLLVDLDDGSILNGVGDESRIIPKKLQKALTTALTTDDPEGRLVSDSTVSEAFLRFFIETSAHYMDFIVYPEDDENTFQREQFVKAANSRGIRLFLEWFTQTQGFEVFISGKLNQNASSGYFEQRIAEHREELESFGSKSLGRKKKALGKKISEFFNRVIK